MRHRFAARNALARLLLACGLLASLMLFMTADLAAQAPAGRPAGKISALIPQDFIVRGTQRIEAARDAQVFWNDTIETSKGGRVRLNLLDGSILNIGSQAKMRVLQHDEASQQTALELSYGKVRASVVKLSQPGSSFQVKTPQAVCGVVGTDEYLDSSPNTTRVISIFGRVLVGSSDPNIPGTQLLETGELTDVFSGQAPGEKRHATDQELHNAIDDTVAGTLGQLSALTGLPGQTLEVVMQGTNLMPVNALSITGEGVSIRVGPGATAQRLPLIITIAADAQPGNRLITVETPRGTVNATFLVRSPGEAAVGAVIGGQWWYAPNAPPEDVQPPNLVVAQGARVLLDGSRSTGQISNYAWEIQDNPLSSAQTTFDIDTWRLSPGSHRVTLRVRGPAGATASADLTLLVRALPNPDDVPSGLRAAYESLQINQFMSYFDATLFRGYPALEENIRNSLQGLNSIRVYMRIDNRQVLGDVATYQAAFEITFSTKDQPDTLQRRVESLTMRLLLNRQRDREFWLITDYSSVTTAVAGVGTGASVIGLTGSSGSPDFTLTISPTSLHLPGSTVTITAAGQFNFAEPITVTAENLPAGVHATSTTLHLPPNGQSVTGTIEITTSADAPPGNALAHVVARAGPVEHTVDIVLQVTSFSVDVSATSLEVPIGGSGSVDVIVTGQNGFNQPVNIQVQGLPAGVTANSLSLIGGTGRLTFTAGSGVTSQQVTVNVVATDPTGQIHRDFSLVLRLTGFRLTISPVTSANSPSDLLIGSSANFTVTVAPLNASVGFGGSVSVVPQLPTGISSSPASANLTANQSQTFAFSAASTASPGVREIPIRGTSGSLSSTVSAFVNVRGDFDLASSPVTSSTSPLVLNPGGSASLQINVLSRGGFTGPVQLSLDPLPAGLSVPQSTVTVNAGSSTTFNFSAASSAAAGDFTLTLRGTAGSVSKTLTIFLSVRVVPSFNLVVSPSTSSGSPLQIIVGDSASFTVSLEAVNGFSDSVSLSFDPVAGLAISPASATISPGSTASFQIQTSAPAPAGTLQITIHGQSGAIQRTATLFVQVASFQLAITPATSSSSPAALAIGGQLTFAVQLQSVNGFSGSAQITVQAPSTVGANPTQTTLSASSSFNLALTGLSGSGVQQVTVTASRGSIQVSTSIFVNLTSPFVLSVRPSASANNPILVTLGSIQTVGVSVQRQAAFTGDINLSVSCTSFLVDINGIACLSTPFTATFSPGQDSTAFNVHINPNLFFETFGHRGRERAQLTSLLPQNFTLTVSASVGDLVVQQDVAFTIVDPFGVQSVSPVTTSSSPAAISSPGSVAASVTFLRFAGFADTISLFYLTPSASFTVTGPSSLTGSESVANFTIQAASGITDLSPQLIQVEACAFSLCQFASIYVSVAGTVSLSVVGAGDTPTNPLVVTEGCSPSFYGAETFGSLTATGPTGGVLYMLGPGGNGSTYPDILPTGLCVEMTTGACQSVGTFSIGGTFNFAAKADSQVTSTAVLLSTTIQAFADSGLTAPPLASVTLYIAVLSGACSQVPPGQLPAKVKPGTSPTSAIVTGSAAAALHIDPDRARAGEEIQAVIFGRNLATTRAVRSSNDALRVNLSAPPQADRLVVTLQPDEGLAPGTYLVAVDTGDGMLSVPVLVLPARRSKELEAGSVDGGPPLKNARPVPSSTSRLTEGASGSVAPAAELVVRREEISVSPALPQAGQAVTFRIPVRNAGRGGADVAAEFAIPGTNVSARDSLRLAAGEEALLVFEWPAATASDGRGFEPRLTLRATASAGTMSGNTLDVSLPRLLVTGGPEAKRPVTGASGSVPGALQSPDNTAHPLRADRTSVEVALGACAAVNLNGGAQTACGSFGDVELRLSADGSRLILAAEGIKAVAAMSPEQVTRVEEGGFAREVAIEIGRVYAVSRNGHAAAVRVRSLDGLEQARRERAARVPGPLDGPRVSRRVDGDWESPGTGERRVRIELEWVLLPDLHSGMN